MFALSHREQTAQLVHLPLETPFWRASRCRLRRPLGTAWQCGLRVRHRNEGRERTMCPPVLVYQPVRSMKKRTVADYDPILKCMLFLGHELTPANDPDEACNSKILVCIIQNTMGASGARKFNATSLANTIRPACTRVHNQYSHSRLDNVFQVGLKSCHVLTRLHEVTDSYTPRNRVCAFNFPRPRKYH